MFKELVEKKHYAFHEGGDDWRDAVRAACQPLLVDGTIEDVYVDEIIRKVEELGPYIVIAPNIAIPHAQEGVGVHDTAMSFMKTERPVYFADDAEHDAQIFVVLASADDEEHMDNLMELSEALSDEDVVAKLVKATKPEDLLALD